MILLNLLILSKYLANPMLLDKLFCLQVCWLLGYMINFSSIATGISAFLVPRQGNSQCAKWCKDNFPTNPGKVCTSLAAKGEGPCFECGPAAPQPPTEILCNGQCVPINDQNCGSCGHVVRYLHLKCL